MKHTAFCFGIAAALVASCSIQEEDFVTPQQDDVIFYASFEQPSEETRVYSNENLYLRWTADDRVSIFNKITYNQQYKFLGETGDNAGGFNKVDAAEFVTGNPIPHVVSVYPYKEGTKISEDEIITINLPSEQHYAENTFGLGANTMVSVSSDNVLQYKNVGGYLRISLYGEGITVSSITLKSNNDEKLAGKASVTMPLNGTPSAVLANDATDEITLICDSPVALGATTEESKDFWFVVPPITFSNGFTVSITQSNGGVFDKSTSKSITIERSKLSKMSPMNVEKALPEGYIVFADDNVKAKLVAAFDTDGDGEISYNEAASVTSGNDLKAAFGAIKTYKSFDEFHYFTGVTYIPSSMFEGWVMTSITLPESLVYLGESSFKNCKSLTSIIIPEGISELPKSIFEGCSGLSSVILPNSLEALSQDAFYGCEGLQSLSLPKALRFIGIRCFMNCSNLSSLYLPESITTIKEMAFKGCTKLKDVHIDSLDWWLWMCDQTQDTYGTYDTELFSCGSSERHLFVGGKELTTITIPSNITNIGDFAFMGCISITSITIPSSVHTIGMYAFMRCSIPSIEIPDSVTKIDIGAFQNCSKLSAIVIPESVSEIYYNTFMNCSSLSSISIPESVISIGTGAFENCISLKSIDIPESVTTLGAYAFRGCTGLTSIVLPKHIQQIGIYTFYGCSKLQSVSIPSEVTAINDYAFYECSSLQEVILPMALITIGQFVFEYCSSLSTLNIPASVTNIGRGAFLACANLSTLTVRPITPPDAGIDLCSWTIGSIYVPAESVEAYKIAKNWSNYADRIQPLAPLPEAVDLGLPSGLEWASFNLGASKPEEYGDYYAWGETKPHYSSLDPLTWMEGKEDGYSWSTYEWCAGDKNTITKYCSNSS